MILEFKLDMPNRGSWNGRWSGEEDYYAIIKTFRSKSDIADVEKLIGESFGYDFGDGWFASVDVREVDSKEAQKLRRKSKGFCNYNWMVDSILKYNEILPRKDWK